MTRRERANHRLLWSQGRIITEIRKLTTDNGVPWPEELGRAVFTLRDAAVNKGRETERWAWETGRRP